jgi:signal transduction histidine kinase
MKFALAGLAAVVLLGVVAAAEMRHLTRDEAIRQAQDTTRLAGEGIVEPALGPGVISGDPAAIARLDHTIRGRVLRDPVVRVKIWTSDGRIIYSDEPRLIGRRYPLGADESKALRNGTSDAEVSDLSRPENRFERAHKKLLEVYKPIRGPGRVPLLFESYSSFSSIAASGTRQWQALAPALIGALVLLWLATLPIAYSMARRLRARQDEREQLLQRAIDAQDLERRRIAGALHDDVVQDLAGLGFSLSAAAARDSGNGTSRILQDAADQARQTMRKLRSTLVDIYPPRLRSAGLQAAIDDLTAPLVSGGTRVDTHIPSTSKLSPQTEALLFRAVQEALRNVAKHAHADNVDVSVTIGRDRAHATVSDDGRGFDLAAAPAENHMGLRVLHDIARDAGGDVRVESAPGEGTRLTLEVPLS